MPNQSKPTEPPSAQWEVIDESLLRYIYDSDQAMYPAPILTYDRLGSWVDSCPELCIVLRRGRDDSQRQAPSASTVADFVLGTIIVIPLLRKYWAQLTGEGKQETGTPFTNTILQEHDVEAGEMFPPRTGAQGSQKAEVGLHVFHIERFPSFTGEEGRKIGFTQLALEEVCGRVGARFPHWSVIGYSGMYGPWEAGNDCICRGRHMDNTGHQSDFHYPPRRKLLH